MAIRAVFKRRHIANSVGEFCNFFTKGMPVTISRYLDERLVMFLETSSRDEALRLLVSRLAQEGKLLDEQVFLDAIAQREKIVSTAIGLGVAIPHAKLQGYRDFFIAVGIHKTGLEWNALDGCPVHLIFMIVGPSQRQTEYLQILSHLTTAIKDEERRKQLLRAQGSREILAAFKGA